MKKKIVGKLKSIIKMVYCKLSLERVFFIFELFFIIFPSRVEIEQYGHAKKHTFCADDAAFYSGKPQNVIWKPKCRDNQRDPGNSLLGALLNADPVGNAKFVFDQVSNKNKNQFSFLTNR